MHIALRGLGDDTVQPIGLDSMGNPIYPSGITVQQLISAPTEVPPSESVTVTPSADYVTNPATGQVMAVTPGSTVNYNPTTGGVSVAPPSNYSGLMVLAAAAIAVFVLSK